MKHLKKFEQLNITTSVSPNFWEMVEIADWKSVIEGYRDNPTINDTHRDFYKKAQERVYLRYDYPQIKKFETECRLLYNLLQEYFKPVWLDEANNAVMPSDDGYWDLVCSVIGLGEKFVESCINNTDLFVDMAKNDYYAENFYYLLQIGEKKYVEIRSSIDPYYNDMKKYNV